MITCYAKTLSTDQRQCLRLFRSQPSGGTPINAVFIIFIFSAFSDTQLARIGRQMAQTMWISAIMFFGGLSLFLHILGVTSQYPKVWGRKKFSAITRDIFLKQLSSSAWCPPTCKYRKGTSELLQSHKTQFKRKLYHLHCFQEETKICALPGGKKPTHITF